MSISATAFHLVPNTKSAGINTEHPEKGKY